MPKKVVKTSSWGSTKVVKKVAKPAPIEKPVVHKKVTKKASPSRDSNKSQGIERLPSGRAIFPDKMRLWGLLQADDYEQWIVAEVKAQTTHEAVWMFNQYYGYPSQEDLREGLSLTGTEQDKYLSICELGGLSLPYVLAMKPHEVRETCGLYEYTDT